MKLEAGSVAVVTGASRGIGTLIARAIADRGLHVVLAARSAEPLLELAAELVDRGVRAITVPADIATACGRAHLVDSAMAAFGSIDLLVNNAGVEAWAHFDRLDADELDRLVAVNLTAPMDLARRVLPGMLTRGRGHIVNIASLAGLGPVADGEPYSATKHGVVGFTKSLRASLQRRGAPVSASCICPGLVADVGMFADASKETPLRAPAVQGVARPEAVVRAVLRSVERDLPQVVVNPGAPSLLLAIALVFPRLGEWLGHRLGIHEVYPKVAAARGRAG